MRHGFRDRNCIGQDVTIDNLELQHSSDPILLENLKPVDDRYPDLSPLC